MNLKVKRIVVEGVIGSGKTTLAKMLAERYGGRLMLEKFDDNPFLPKFYAEPDRYAFPLELSFLAERYRQQKEEAVETDVFAPVVVSDYLLSKSLIYAEATLSDDEFQLFRTLFNIVHRRMPPPELIIYLNCPPKQALRNIALRGRTYELSISETYLEKINSLYSHYFKSQQWSQILVIDSEGKDFVNNLIERQEIFHSIDLHAIT